MRRIAFHGFFFVATTLVACGTFLGAEDDVTPPTRTEPDAATNADVVNATGESDAAIDSDRDAALDADAGTMKKHVFVTRATFAGGFGSRAKADEACTTAANTAGRAGTWKAHLADLDGAAPAIRIADREWWLYDGRRIFVMGPKSGAPQAGIAIDEHGAAFTTEVKFVWTGLANATTAAERTCAGWTSDGGAFGGFGDMFATDGTWQQSFGTADCADKHRLYCFED